MLIGHPESVIMFFARQAPKKNLNKVIVDRFAIYQTRMRIIAGYDAVRIG
jgi:hypothetical protein